MSGQDHSADLRAFAREIRALLYSLPPTGPRERLDALTREMNARADALDAQGAPPPPKPVPAPEHRRVSPGTVTVARRRISVEVRGARRRPAGMADFRRLIDLLG